MSPGRGGLGRDKLGSRTLESVTGAGGAQDVQREGHGEDGTA